MFTKTGVHAIRALTILAELPEGRYQGAAAIAEATQAPPNYLGKLLQMMARSGLVQSQKGLGGGFRLARDPHDIKIYEVIESIGDLRRFDACIFGGESCSDANPCAVHHQWAAVRRDYLDMLRNTSIVDLLPSAEHRGAGLLPVVVIEGKDI